MQSSANNMPAQPGRFKLFLMRLRDTVLGIPSHYGRLRPRAYIAFLGMSQELARFDSDLRALQTSHEFVLAKNRGQHDQIQELAAKYREVHGDLVRMSKALKELANHPNVLSPASQDVLRAFKVSA